MLCKNTKQHDIYNGRDNPKMQDQLMIKTQNGRAKAMIMNVQFESAKNAT